MRLEKLKRAYKAACDFSIWLIQPGNAKERQDNQYATQRTENHATSADQYQLIRGKFVGHMTIILIGTLATLVIGLAGVVASHGQRSVSIWLFYVAYVLYGFVGFKVWDDSATATPIADAHDGHEFSASSSWTQAELGHPCAWFVNGNGVTPIHRTMLVTLTSFRRSPTLITSYIIECQSSAGIWETVSLPYGSYGGAIYQGSDKKSVSEFSYTSLDSSIANKNIVEGETVRGWVFICKDVVGFYRIKFTDALGNIYVEQFKGISRVGWESQPMMMESLHRGKVDISGLPNAPIPQ